MLYFTKLFRWVGKNDEGNVGRHKFVHRVIQRNCRGCKGPKEPRDPRFTPRAPRGPPVGEEEPVARGSLNNRL